MSKTIQGKNKIICDFCGKVKNEVIFCIGASSKNDWCMVEGTGKMTCPDCYELAMLEGEAIIESHIAAHNARVERIARDKFIKGGK